ncbi:MAG: DUF1570 domain-containing protein [Planctomycetota bacterium]
MIKILKFTVFLLVFSSTLSLFSDEGTITWLAFEEGFDKMIDKGQLGVLFLCASKDEKEMQSYEDFFSHAEVKKVADAFVWIKVDCDKDEETAVRFKVRKNSMLVIINLDEEELKKYTKPPKAEDFIKDLEKSKKKYIKETEPWQRQKPDDAFYKDNSNSIPWEKRHRLETKYYSLETNVSMSQAKKYADMLDKIFEKYCDFFSKPRAAGKFLVSIYRNRDEWVNAATQRASKPGNTNYAFYDPNEKRVLAYHGRNDILYCTQTNLFHECAHQFHDAVSGSIQKSLPWFYEGLAHFFTFSEIDEKGEIHIGVIDVPALEQIKRDCKSGNTLHLSELFSIPAKEFTGLRINRYAWGVVYFLLQSNDVNLKIFKNYWSKVACGTGESPKSNKFINMLGMSLEKFEECWKEWIQILEPTDTPEAVERKSKKFFRNWKKKEK